MLLNENTIDAGAKLEGNRLLLNRRQRDFRKSMKDIEKQKKQAGHEDPYSYREENYRPRRYRKPMFMGAGGFTLLVIVWNVFATSTWLHPRHGILPTSGVSAQLNGPNPGFIVSNDQQAVSDYIQTSDQIATQLHALLLPFLNPATASTISSQVFSLTKSQLNQLQQSALTSLSALTPLRSYNLEQIELVQAIVDHVQHYGATQSSSDWNLVQQLVQQYNRNMSSQKAAVIAILNQAHMRYLVHPNGHITYYYVPSTSP